MKVAVVGGVRLGALVNWLDQRASDTLGNLPEGGQAAPATPIVSGLLRRGHEVTVIGLHSSVSDEVRLEGDGLTVCVGPYRARHRARDWFKVERGYITAALRRERPDIAHAQWSYENALGALASGLPTLVTVRDWAPRIFRLRPDPYRLVRLLMNVQALSQARYLTVASPYMANRLRRWRRDPIAILPNALSEEAFLDGPVPIRSRPSVIVAVNNGFGKLKNVTTLLQAFPHIREAHPQCQLRLIGPDYEPGGRAETWARAQRLTFHVSFEGAVPAESLRGVFRSADIFVHPSLEESFGTVLLEACAHGLPTVGGQASGAVPWVLDDGRAGLLTDVRSVSKLTSAVLQLLGDEEARRQYGRAGYQHARQHFSLSRVLDRYLWAYGFVLGQP